jgi:hypothetical protein
MWWASTDRPAGMANRMTVPQGATVQPQRPRHGTEPLSTTTESLQLRPFGRVSARLATPKIGFFIELQCNGQEHIRSRRRRKENVLGHTGAGRLPRKRHRSIVKRLHNAFAQAGRGGFFDERVSACGRKTVRGGAAIGSVERGCPAQGCPSSHVGRQRVGHALRLLSRPGRSRRC